MSEAKKMTEIVKPSIREQLGAILSKYSFQSMLDAYSDQTIRQMLLTYVTPLNITTLAGAKAEIYKQTGFSPDMFISSQADQEKIWVCCQEFMKGEK
jgi:hypothetical protein